MNQSNLGEKIFLITSLLFCFPLLCNGVCGKQDEVYISIVMDLSKNVFEDNFYRFKKKIINEVIDSLPRTKPPRFAMSVCRYDESCRFRDSDTKNNQCFFNEEQYGEIRKNLDEIHHRPSSKEFDLACNKKLLFQMQKRGQEDKRYQTYNTFSFILTVDTDYIAYILQSNEKFLKLKGSTIKLPELINERICNMSFIAPTLSTSSKKSINLQTSLNIEATSYTPQFTKELSLTSNSKQFSTKVFSTVLSSNYFKSTPTVSVDPKSVSSVITPTIEQTGGLLSTTKVHTSLVDNITVKNISPSTTNLDVKVSSTSRKLKNTLTSKVKILPTSSIKVIVTSSLEKEIEQIKTDIDNVLKTNESNFANETFSKEFLEKTVNLIEKSIETQNPEIRVENFLSFLDDSYKKIGALQKSGQKTEIKSGNSMVEIATFDDSDYKGFVYNGDNNNVNANLPPDIFKESVSSKRIIVIMHIPSPLYMRNVSRYSTSKILSITTDPVIKGTLMQPLKYAFTKQDQNKSYKCVFWNESLKISNKWDTNGCVRIISTNQNQVECECNHMTSFSLLVQTEKLKIPKDHETALTIISYIGCGVSIFACISLVLLYLAFGRVMKYDRNLIHMNLCVAIALSNILFLIAGNVADHKNLCLGISVSLLYCCLGCFFWMLIEGIHVYAMVVKVFNTSNRWKMYMIIGWLCPAIIVVIIAARYHKYFTRPYFCWVSTEKHVIWSFIGPVVVIILINSYILLRTLRASYKMDRSNDIVRKYRRLAHLSVILLPIFGLTWVFGFFSINNLDLIFFQYIFNILNSFQGLFIFIFYALLNNDIKREYEKFRRASSYFSTPRSSETTLDDISHKRWSQLSVKRLFKPKDSQESEDNVFHLQTKSL